VGSSFAASPWRRALFFVMARARFPFVSGALRSLAETFTLLTGGERHLRWFEFDSGGTGGTVSFFAHQSGQPGLAGGGFDELQRAMAAWNAEPHTPIHLTYAGTTTAKGGLTTDDHVNAVLWDDPNDEIGVPFDCKHVRGPLAVGVPRYDLQPTQIFQGETMVQIVGADILTNKNLACSAAGSTTSPSSRSARPGLFASSLCCRFLSLDFDSPSVGSREPHGERGGNPPALKLNLHRGFTHVSRR
jgi:hypothetical protein